MESNIYKAARMTRWLAYGILTVALACLLAGCNGDSGAPEATPAETELTEPTDTVEPAPTPTPEPTAGSVVPQRTVTPVPAPTPTAEATPGSTQAPIVTPTPTPTAAARPGYTSDNQTRDDAYALAASAIPFFDEWLSEYEVWCYEMKNLFSEDPTDFTYGELSAAQAKATSATPATNPPDVVARWHNFMAGRLQSINDFADEQPEDDRVDLDSIEEHLRAWAEEHQITDDTANEIDEEMPGYIRAQMAPAGCMLGVGLPDAATLVAVEFPNATLLPAGEITEGPLDPDYDFIDYFRFQLEEGQLYRIVPIILSERSWSSPRLYDADGQRISEHRQWQPWQPPSSGEYYYEIIYNRDATYRLKLITISDIDDDHGNSPEDATSLTAGQSAAGAVDEWLDFDYFRFQAEEGQLYRIEVVTRTLPDALLNVDDFDEWNFSTESSEGRTSIVGEAPGTGTFWVVVGHGEEGTTGTYTLTVTAL